MHLYRALFALPLLALLLSARAWSQDDFIRGDANNDGVVSIADVHRIRISLLDSLEFPGFTCLAAADANDDGRATGDDWMYVFDRVACACVDLVAPYPSPGQDLTANQAELLCESYGGGALLEDPQASFRMLHGFAYGGTDGTALITLGLTSSRAVAAYSATLRVPDFVIGIVDDPEDETDRASSRRVGASLRDGRLHFAFLLTSHLRQALEKDRGIVPPGEGMPALTIELCLAEGTAAGDYPIEIETAEFADFETGEAIHPELMGGTLEVFQEVTDNVGCVEEPSPPTFPPTPPTTDPDIIFALGDVAAVPGQEATVPFTLRADREISGFSFSIDDDETLLDLVEVVHGPALTAADAPELLFEVVQINNDDDNPGSAGIDEGFVIGAVVFHPEPVAGPPALPPDLDHRVYDLIFRVEDEVTVESTEITFRDGGQGTGQPTFNVVTVDAQTEVPATSSAFAVLNGSMLFNVIPEGSVFNREFVRGDANMDQALDISDPISILESFFLGTRPLVCPDAADADDNGTLDVTDPIVILDHMFLNGGVTRLPPPYPGPGPDPTPDDLNCPS